MEKNLNILKTKMKRVIIPWSGGVDSTYLIHKNLEEGNEVRTFSVLLNNNISQRDREKSSRSILSKYFREKYPGKFSEDTSYNFNSIQVSSSYNMILSQPPIWILFCYYSFDLSGYDEIQIGYIMNDDAISYLDDIRNLHSSYKPFTNYTIPELKFPLTKMKKWEIMNQLPEFIMKNVSYCEYYDEKNCACLSCKRHNDELKSSDWKNIKNSSDVCVKEDLIEEKYSSITNSVDCQLTFDFSEN